MELDTLQSNLISIEASYAVFQNAMTRSRKKLEEANIDLLLIVKDLQEDESSTSDIKSSMNKEISSQAVLERKEKFLRHLNKLYKRINSCEEKQQNSPNTVDPIIIRQNITEIGEVAKDVITTPQGDKLPVAGYNKVMIQKLTSLLHMNASQSVTLWTKYIDTKQGNLTKLINASSTLVKSCVESDTIDNEIVLGADTSLSTAEQLFQYPQFLIQSCQAADTILQSLKQEHSNTGNLFEMYITQLESFLQVKFEEVQTFAAAELKTTTKERAIPSFGVIIDSLSSIQKWLETSWLLTSHLFGNGEDTKKTKKNNNTNTTTTTPQQYKSLAGFILKTSNPFTIHTPKIPLFPFLSSNQLEVSHNRISKVVNEGINSILSKYIKRCGTTFTSSPSSSDVKTTLSLISSMCHFYGNVLGVSFLGYVQLASEPNFENNLVTWIQQTVNKAVSSEVSQLVTGLVDILSAAPVDYYMDVWKENTSLSLLQLFSSLAILMLFPANRRGNIADALKTFFTSLLKEGELSPGFKTVIKLFNSTISSKTPDLSLAPSCAVNFIHWKAAEIYRINAPALLKEISGSSTNQSSKRIIEPI